MSAQTEEIIEPQLSEDAQSTVKDGASIVLEAEGSRPNTAESKSDSCSTATCESREPAQKPDSQPDRDAHDASGSSEFSDQENERKARSSGDDVLLEEERGSISDDMDAEAGLHNLDDDDSCSEGTLECISRDVGLGENPFASPSISRVVAADDHRTATASPVNHDPYSPDFTPRRFFPESGQQDMLRGNQMVEQQAFQGSPNPAQLHRRPYTPEKYSPQQQDRRRCHPSAAPRQGVELQSDWAAEAGGLWHSQFQDGEREMPGRRLSGRLGAARQILRSPRSCAPPPLDAYAAQQHAWQGGPPGMHYDWQQDNVQRMSYNSRPQQGFYEGHAGIAQPMMCPPQGTQQGNSTGYLVHSSFVRSLSDRSGQQHLQHHMAELPQQHASLARGWPVPEAGGTNAVQPWNGADPSEVEELQQELANAQAAERDYLGTVRSLSARLEAAMGREAALRQRLSRAEAAASTLATREPSPRVEIPAEQLVTATESNTEMPVQVQSTAKAHEENGTEAEPPSSPDAETADDEASQRTSKGTLEQSEGGVTKAEREHAAMAALQDSLDAANETCRNLQRELALANKRLESTAVENRQADGQLARMRTANAELEASLEHARAEISQLMDQLREDSRALKAAERHRHEAELQAVSLRQALDAAKRAVAARDQDFARLQQNLHSARAELAELQSRYRQLERSSLMSQPAVPPAGTRPASHISTSPLPTSRQEGTPRQTVQHSPRRRSDASLRSSVETATRGFTRGPPTLMVFHHDPVPKLAALHNRHQRFSSPELQNGAHNTDSVSVASFEYAPQPRQRASQGQGSLDQGDSTGHPEDCTSPMSDELGQRKWLEEERQMRHAQPQIGGQNGRAPILERPAAGLASNHSGTRQTASQQQQAQQQQQQQQQQPSRPYREEEPWDDTGSLVQGAESGARASPYWDGIHDDEGRPSSAAQRSDFTDSSGGRDGRNAGHVMHNGAGYGAAVHRQEQDEDVQSGSSTFRPYATDMSLQDFMRRQKVLEDRLLVLNEEDKRLEAEYARMSAVSAGRTLAERRRRAEVESTLEANKREGSNLRLQLKRLGLQ